MFRFSLGILFVLTVWQPLAAAQGAPDVAGRWDGAVELPEGPPFEVIVKLQQAKPQQNGDWRGTIDLLTQGDADVPLQNIQVEGKIVKFTITGVPGKPTFDGTFSGDAIEGTFIQSEQKFPFSLSRKVALSVAERNAALEQGRSLTKLFYDRNFAEIYAKFTVFVSQTELEEFRQEIEDQVGNETAIQTETVDETGNILTYVRTATFSKLELPVEVQWNFSTQGVVEGLSVQLVQNAAQENTEAPRKRLEYQTKTALRLPFDSEWFVFWGGRTVAENYHAAYPDQRFAADFVVLKGNSSHRGDGAKLTDYYCFGRSIYAPGAGTVVETLSNLPDLPTGESDTENVAGNYVIIDHRNGEFSFLGHLQQGSVKVTAGERVEAGALIGRCGNSGNTSEPHLHYQLQAGAALFGAEALPAQFLNYRADGKRVVRGEPVKGQQVERLE